VGSGPASVFAGVGDADADGEPTKPLAGRAIGVVAGVPAGDVVVGGVSLVVGYAVVLSADPGDGVLIVPELTTGTDVVITSSGGLGAP
jgi:hypothetical protein